MLCLLTMKKWIKYLLLGFVLLIVPILIFVLTQITIVPIDGDNPPVFIQADFVQLDKIFAISKFRSGVGHDFSYNSGETCRSMKHYFTSIDIKQPNYKAQKLEDIKWPRPVEGTDVTIFSPVDGTITYIYHDKKSGWNSDEIVVTPASHQHIRIRLMHVTPLPEIKWRTKVTAGQPIGLVLANQCFDIVIESISIGKTTYISYFDAMPDSIFAKYQARGIISRDDLIISKEERDSNPLECNVKSGEFAKNYADGQEGEKQNMNYLSGYETIREEAQSLWYDNK